MGMAVFTDHLIEALGLSRTELSIAYLLGTLGSSLFLTRAGRFYDETGARISIVASSIGLGLFVSFIACIGQVAQALNNITAITSSLITFPLILLGYFGVRFAGQGVLTNSARNVLLVWFEKRRGLVVGARSVFITFGFSLAPPFLAFLIAYFGWRGALFVLAVISGVIFSLIALIFIRDTPESCACYLMETSRRTPIKRLSYPAKRWFRPKKVLSSGSMRLLLVFTLYLERRSFFILSRYLLRPGEVLRKHSPTFSRSRSCRYLLT